MKETKHAYGDNVHILDDLYLTSTLTELCQPETTQPLINELVDLMDRDPYTGCPHTKRIRVRVEKIASEAVA